MQFRVLGPLEVDAGSGPIPLGGPKQRAVLAHLLFRANELVLAETLVDEIWGEEPPEKARNIIQTYISHLRKALGHDRIQGHAPGYRLTLDTAELDAARFDALMRDAKKALPVDPNIAVGTLDDALALWRGPALADLADQPSLLAEAARLDGLRLEAQENRIEGLLASGAQARAIGELETLLARHPWRETLWGLLMLAFYREGRQADALGAFQRAREILADELGIDPSPELTRLHDRVLKQDAGLDLRGEPLRGYRLLEKIDDGPTGVVFRAIQPHVGRDVAVKIFHEAIATDPAFVRRFEPDAQAVAALEHPYVVPIYDYWREPGRAYIVSRYLRGGSLRALEERGESLERDRALRVVEQIALALAFAHRQGVAHGSMRSSNVLFDGEGNACVEDFRIGTGKAPDPLDDVRELAGLATRLLPHETSLAELAERVEVGRAPDADAFAKAARGALEPTSVATPRRVDERNPYKGLRAFTEPDARDFFGRGELTRRLVARLRESEPGSRFLAVVGASGGGKSSVVRAGLLPAVRHGALGTKEDPFIAELFPGAHPIDELEAALLRVALRPVPRLHDRLESGSRGLLEAVDLIAPGEAEVVLVVDQFEEIFTLTTDQRERELFLEALRVAAVDPESRLRVIVTLRADFYDRPLIYPRFGELLADRTEVVPPLTPDELEQAIRGPAEGVGVSPEPGLVAEMIAEVAHQPGALPLLQYALTELFERRHEDRLTLAAYQEIGGVAGALSARADRIYEGTNPRGHRATKQVFLRLVTLGEGRQDTRRRVVASELDALEVDQEAIDAVVETFGRHRLLTFDREPSTREPTVEIAHEALLNAWGRLRTWIDGARDDLRQYGGMARAAAEWRGSDADPSFLMRGARLEQVEKWAATTDLAIGRPQRAFLKASGDQRDREQKAEAQRRAHEAQIERRSARRLRGLVAVFAAAALIAGSLTVVATNQSSRASSEADRAEREARIATARELATGAVANLDVDPERSILLALEAVDATSQADGFVVREAEEALHRAVSRSRVVFTVPQGGGLAVSADGTRFGTTGRDGTATVWEMDTGERLLTLGGHDGAVQGIAFSSDGRRLATTGDDGTVRVWDGASGRQIHVLRGHRGVVWSPAFSPDGRRLATIGKDSTVRIWDVAGGTEETMLTGPKGTAFGTGLFIPELDFSPDGSRVASPRADGKAGIWDLATGETTEVLSGHIWEVTDVAFSPNGRRIATSSADGTVRIHDAATGEHVITFAGHGGDIDTVDYSPDGSRIATGSDDGTARVWDTATAEHLMTLAGNTGSIKHVAFTPDGDRLLTAGGDGTTRLWDISLAGARDWLTVPGPNLRLGGFAFSPVGTTFAVPGQLRGVTIRDVDTGKKLISLKGHNATITRVAFSPDGTRLAGAVCSDTAQRRRNRTIPIWDVSTGELVMTLTGHGEEICAVAFSPDGRRLATGGAKGTVRVWDAATGRQQGKMKMASPTFGLAFTPDGRFVVAGEDFKKVATVWDADTFEKVSKLKGHTGGIQDVEFSPDGRLVTASPGDGSAKIWDMESGRELLTLRGQVFDAAFSPDGARVATVSIDGIAKLWDAATGRELLTLFGPRQVFHTVAFSPDGRLLAAASYGFVALYLLPIDELRGLAGRRVTRGLTDEECRQYLHVDQCPRGGGSAR